MPWLASLYHYCAFSLFYFDVRRLVSFSVLYLVPWFDKHFLNCIIQSWYLCALRYLMLRFCNLLYGSQIANLFLFLVFHPRQDTDRRPLPSCGAILKVDIRWPRQVGTAKCWRKCRFSQGQMGLLGFKIFPVAMLKKCRFSHCKNGFTEVQKCLWGDVDENGDSQGLKLRSVGYTNCSQVPWRCPWGN